jgi:ATP-dependent 26S proteasome regulatory subunit
MDKFTYIAVWTERLEVKELEKKYEKTEEDLKAVQSVGQIVAEVLKQLDDERCEVEFPLCSFYYFSLSYTRISSARFRYIFPVNTGTI